MLLGKSPYYIGKKELTDPKTENNLSEKGRDVLCEADEAINREREKRIGTYFDQTQILKTDMKLERPDDDTLATLMQIMYLAEKKGIIINYDTDMEKLSFHVRTDRYLGHGGRQAKVKSARSGNGTARNVLNYADIIYMLQTRTDKEIIEETGIPRATYYRHKKKMMASKYYEKLDKNRLSDMEYLKSQGHVPNF